MIVDAVKVANLISDLQEENKRLQREINKRDKVISNLKQYIDYDINSEAERYIADICNLNNRSKIRKILNTKIIKYSHEDLTVKDILVSILNNNKKDIEELSNKQYRHKTEDDRFIVTLLYCLAKMYDVWRVHDTRIKAASIVEKMKYDNSVCEKCGKVLDKGDIEVHHIIPVKAGGTNSKYNLMKLCHNCHVKENKKNKKYKSPEILYQNIYKLFQN